MAGCQDDAAIRLLGGDRNLSGRSGRQPDVNHVMPEPDEGSRYQFGIHIA